MAPPPFTVENGGTPPTDYTVGVTNYTDVELLNFLTATQGESGGSVTGSLTVNNNVDRNGPNPSAGAPFATIDAYGILVNSTGGMGSTGGCTTYLIYTECRNGWRGGDAGSVVVNSNSSITVNWVNGLVTEQHGIAAVSQGGNGGNGGGAFGLFASDAGRGGDGGNSNNVYVMLGIHSNITTNATRSHGVYAASRGGDGGSGGAPSGLVALGSKGGNGGDAGDVLVDNDGLVLTMGAGSHGIYGLSVGAGAGSGSGSGGLVAIGGNGGGESNGAKVTINNSGSVATQNTGAFGILAQSIGGGGGDGGDSGGLFTVGGKGGSGGNSDKVMVFDSGSVTTSGDGSTAIIAQSIGGGGGNGGDATSISPTVSVAIGGDGSLGGHGHDVVVTTEGSDIDTSGNTAHGIVAQSIGGGGGNGGRAISGALPSGSPVNVSVALGGDAGGGNDAGDTVTVTTSDTTDIDTTGTSSAGIIAQSIGGGGGNGGSAYSATGGGSINVALAIGGKGGTGGSGKTVSVNNAATISTGSDLSTGILAQSVGGGGGNGGFAGTLAIGGGAASIGLGGSGAVGGSSGLVTVTNSNTIDTAGANATGILAQSIGGGGGNGGSAISGSAGGLALSAAVGGSGGGGNNGSAVTVNNSGNVTTVGSLSHGIYGHSVGGGGGNGGFALSGSLAFSVGNMPGGAAAISVGGAGGGASHGGQVTVNNSGSIDSSGLGAHAIYAQSVGGGGGNGGFAGSIAMTIGQGAAVGVAVGGSGSGGGNAGSVIVNDTNTTASIITRADGADGIHAHSVGGGGGDGGFAFSGAFGFSKETSVNVAVAIGGAGGAGGTGNTVDVTSHSAITTYGNKAIGVMAQSIGGGGGNGGMAIDGMLTFSETAGAVGVSVGGAGGTGNIGNTVTVDNYGEITTDGNDAMGILAQSIGGSGGNGGLSVAAQMTGSSKNAATVGVSIGGGAGVGNFGGIVNTTNHSLGSILTKGLGSHGIKAQSIGGGGGNGGLAIAAQLGKSGGSEEQASKTLNVGVSLGGEGGTGGYGNTVHVINDGSITVEGESATGIFAQSLGGGGGDGGASVSGIGMLTDSQNTSSRSLAVNVSLGGTGGSGNYGGAVTVDNTGAIVTRGGNGHGVFAHSIGGGGGVGGRANTIQMLLTNPLEKEEKDGKKTTVVNKNNIKLGATIGGKGGTGGHGGDVVVNNQGMIETWNQLSDGINAQSIGAGGGTGGNGAIGGDGLLPIPGGKILIETVIKKIGGLQGSTEQYTALDIAVGGSAGATGNGGTVTVNNNKNIITHGLNSDGIFAESIGGGGGVGGKAVIGLTGKIGLGGEGGAAGDGGNVTVNQSGGATIETFGVASNGIFAHSVGGGGGIAGNVDRLLAKQGINLGIGVALGRSGGGGGDGGIVDVDVDGNIITHGNSAAGIFAQSVGGGGGVLGELGNEVWGIENLSWQVGSIGAAGNAGQVDVDLTGNIVTAGNEATGIFAQSSGGTGTAGPVNVTLNSSILTGEVLQAGDENRGLGSVGIIAQSIAVDNADNGNISVAINSIDGVVRGGRSQVVDSNNEHVGVGIWLKDGKDNTIINSGHITSYGGAGDVAGYAILATGSDAIHLGGNEIVTNFGRVSGNVSLGAGVNAFTNKQGATFNTGAMINLGTGNNLTNEGTLLPGGINQVFTTSVTGNLVQASSGSISVDMDSSSGTADRLDVIGTAALAGVASVNILNPGWAAPGTHLTTIITGTDGVTDSGMSLQYQPSAVIDYTLVYSSPTEVVLRTSINFAPSQGLSGNQSVIGEAINTIQRAGGSASFAPVVATLAGLPNAQAIGNAYNTLSPESYGASMTTSLEVNQLYSQTLVKRMHSIRSYVDRTGLAPGVKQTLPQSVWIDGFRKSGDQDADSGFTGFEHRTVGVAIGMDRLFKAGLLGGMSIGKADTAIDPDSEMGQGEIESFQFALYGSVFSDQYYLDTAVSYGRQSFTNLRKVAFGALSEMVASSHHGDLFSAYTEAGYNFKTHQWITQPFVALQYSYLEEERFGETGGGGLNLNVEKRNSDSLITDLGSRFNRPYQKDDLLYIPEISIAWRHDYDIDDHFITAAFDGAPDVFFTTESRDTEKDGVLIGAGITLLNTSGLNMYVRYDNEIRGGLFAQQVFGGFRNEF